MSRSPVRRVPVVVLVLALAAGCAAQQVAGTASPADGPGSSGSSAAPSAAPVAPGATLAPGPVTVIALGDSLTAAEGDEEGKGFAGRLADAVAARPDRTGSALVNLGQSGWDSTAMVEGQQDAPAELPQAVTAARAAPPGSVLATVLIGSNDLWFAYQNGSENPTPTAEEDAVVATYRKNLERTVQELQDAGAIIVVGLPDDQSLRPVAADIARINEALSEVTQEEVGKMSALSKVLDRTAAEVATAHGVRTVDTNDAFWADPARMAEDGIHPNAAGYAQMAGRWVEAVEPLL